MTDSGPVCMVFDESGNAFDCFEFIPEELERKARELRAQLVTMEPNPWATLAVGVSLGAVPK